MIEIEHLKKEYENVTPLEDVNVTINEGDIISVIAFKVHKPFGDSDLRHDKGGRRGDNST